MAAIAAPATVATIQKIPPADSVRGGNSFALLSAVERGVCGSQRLLPLSANAAAAKVFRPAGNGLCGSAK